MNILVTGGCGYKGSVLVPELLKDGHSVVSFDTNWFGDNLKEHKSLTKIRGDVRNIDSIISSFKPPIFWKDKEIVKTQIMNWDAIEIENLIYKINDIEFIVKKNTINTLNIVSDFILNTSSKPNN